MRPRVFRPSSACPPNRATSCCSRVGCATECRRRASPARASRLAPTIPAAPGFAAQGAFADGTSQARFSLVRRQPVRLLAALLVLLAALPAWADCPLDLGRGTGLVVFSDHYMVAFRPDPFRI